MCQAGPTDVQCSDEGAGTYLCKWAPGSTNHSRSRRERRHTRLDEPINIPKPRRIERSSKHGALSFIGDIIADHLASHYIDEYKSNDTDWVNHHNFGNFSATTVHSIFKIFACPFTRSSIGATAFSTNSKTYNKEKINIFDNLVAPRLKNINQPLFNYENAILGRLY